MVDIVGLIYINKCRSKIILNMEYIDEMQAGRRAIRNGIYKNRWDEIEIAILLLDRDNGGGATVESKNGKAKLPVTDRISLSHAKNL